MNWLAHLYLSENNPEYRLGSILADLVRSHCARDLRIDIRRGIKCHLAVDSFTDSHPLVLASRRYIRSPYKRFSGILIDIFYDHFLAKNWSIYDRQSLREFTVEVYNDFFEYKDYIPPIAKPIVFQMAEEDWLGSYYQIAGIAETLNRISHRFKKNFFLDRAIDELLDNYEALENNFKSFFPELSDRITSLRF